tara:strand:- start:319 stop:582 length:264 start_codon:yes stop_codon:yes gene_type:complete
VIVEIILGLLILIEGYVIWNLNRKTEMLETWVENFSQLIEAVQNNLKEVDSKGYFEEDDEVGSTFKRVKEIVKQLDEFKGEEVNVSD